MALLEKQTIYYAKVLGDPVPGFDKQTREWSFEISLDKKGLAEIKKLKLDSRVKNKGDEKGNYLTFRRNEFKKDGKNTPNEPIPVIDHHGNPWNPKVKIGNGSVVNVRFNVYPAQKGNKAVPLALQVWEHKEYKSSNGFPIDETRPSVNSVLEAEAAEFDEDTNEGTE